MSDALRQQVRQRAKFRCEYCHFHERHLPLWGFHLDHIVAEQHGGTDALDNLAWSCQRCNLKKGTNLTGIDPDSGMLVRLFHPRHDNWEEHFIVQSGRMHGKTAIGRATAWLLDMNSQDRIELRLIADLD